MNAFAEGIAAARDAFVPPRCAGCDGAGAWFCPTCESLLDPAALPVRGCPTRGAGVYAGPLREAVHRLKYGGERGLAAELGRAIARLLAADAAVGIASDAVVPVPLHKDRRIDRGYDQALLLATAVAQETGLPLRPALRRIRSGPSQVTLDRPARAANVRGAFVVGHGELRGLRVALIDDVSTTGATLAAAATAARTGGARDVRGYVVAVDE